MILLLASKMFFPPSFKELVQMKVKIDTKERFHVINLEESVLSANMTEELKQTLLPYLEMEIKNVILRLKSIEEIDITAANTIVSLQQTFYDNNASFVICEMQKSITDFFNQQELLETLNVTPSESEACDIVQMEDIEREFGDV
ncbi:MAG TPA: STAS domain-containing protein [Chitinophagaceae bacterium]|nr:STAS domain-containing protein [Chitinophagaceae bacterium]